MSSMASTCIPAPPPPPPPPPPFFYLTVQIWTQHVLSMSSTPSMLPSTNECDAVNNNGWAWEGVREVRAMITKKSYYVVISYPKSTKSKIGDRLCMLFSIQHAVTVADLLRGLTIFRYWKGKYRWASGAKWSLVENREVDGGLFVLLFADSFRYVPARTQKLLAGRMGNTPYTNLF